MDKVFAIQAYDVTTLKCIGTIKMFTTKALAIKQLDKLEAESKDGMNGWELVEREPEYLQITRNKAPVSYYVAELEVCDSEADITTSVENAAPKEECAKKPAKKPAAKKTASAKAKKLKKAETKAAAAVQGTRRRGTSPRS